MAKVLTPDLDPVILQGIGNVTTTWAYVDSLLGELFAFIIGADKGTAYIVTMNVMSGTLTNWIRTMVPVKFSNDITRDTVLSLIERVEKVRAERNTYVHGLWKRGAEPGTALCQTFRWERNEIVQTHLVTSADLDELCHEIRGLISELGALGERLGFLDGKPAA